MADKLLITTLALAGIVNLAWIALLAYGAITYF